MLDGLIIVAIESSNIGDLEIKFIGQSVDRLVGVYSYYQNVGVRNDGQNSRLSIVGLEPTSS